MKRICILLCLIMSISTLTGCFATDLSSPADNTEHDSADSSETYTESIGESDGDVTTENSENTSVESTDEATASESDEELNESDTTTPEESGFAVHFIDVGQADAALIICDGKAMLIDGGNVADSSKLYSYLKKYSISHLDYVIGTHAHEDHIGGIAGALNYASVDVVFCPVKTYASDAFNNFVKAVDKHGAAITIPTAGTTFSLGSADCKVLAVNTESDTNNSSIVLKITYGNTSFLFTGDAEREVEQTILDQGYTLESTLLKVGHHGSETSTGYLFLREVMPEYAIISVGDGNTYGHPTEEVLSRLRDAEVKTFRTDMQGDIICISDGNTVTVTVSRNADADVFGNVGGNSTQHPDVSEDSEEPVESEGDEPQGDEPQGTNYVLNTNTKKFHYSSCSSAEKISDANRQEFGGMREELIAMGYSPCGNCNP